MTAKTVWVMRGGPRPVPVPIKVGLSDGTFTEVAKDKVDCGRKRQQQEHRLA